MASALALVVVIAVGLPLAAWLITRRLPPPRPWGRLGAGYDAIDKWLLERYQLAPQERWRVRQAVFRGQQVSEAELRLAAHGLAAQVLSGGFWILRASRVLGWVDLAFGIGLTGIGIATLVTNRQAAVVMLGILGIIGAQGFIFAGIMRAVVSPKKIHQNVAKALQLDQHG